MTISASSVFNDSLLWSSNDILAIIAFQSALAANFCQALRIIIREKVKLEINPALLDDIYKIYSYIIPLLILSFFFIRFIIASYNIIVVNMKIAEKKKKT